jgi:hypothetical protein
MRSLKRLSRREFLRRSGIASSALTLSPFYLERCASVCQAAANLTRVYKVLNATTASDFGISQLLAMMGGIGQFVNPTDVVVIKANAQWPNQGYTHTGCIKGVIDAILAIPNYSGEIIICDNLQTGGTAGETGFDATTSYRNNNWPDQNWNSLAALYQAAGKPVSAKSWGNNGANFTLPSKLPGFVSWSPAGGEGWGRYFFAYNAGGSSSGSFVSCPVFESPLTSGRMIDMQPGGGVWESGAYTGRKVKAIFMPTLNNHGTGAEDGAGVTSAIKCFYGATEIPGGPGTTSNNCLNLYNGFYSAHGDCQGVFGQTVGTMTGNFICNLYAPVLYITPAIYAGTYNRWDEDGATATNTVLACTNPVTLDYVSCRDIMAPYAPWLNPDKLVNPGNANNTNNTRRQILACNGLGIGTINPQQFEVIVHDLLNPSTGTRLSVEQAISNFKAGTASEQTVKSAIQAYMEGE